MHVADASAATSKSKTIEEDFLSGFFSKVDDGLHLVRYTSFMLYRSIFAVYLVTGIERFHCIFFLSVFCLVAWHNVSLLQRDAVVGQ